MRERHARERLSAFLDDELEEQQALEVARHLARCDACLEELEEIRAARAALRRLPDLHPPASLFTDAVARATCTHVRRQRGLRVALSALGAWLALGTVAFVAGAEARGTVTPPVDLFVVDHVTRFGGGPMITPVDLGSRAR